MLRARWRLAGRLDPAAVLATGLAAAERGLEIDATDADFLLVKGRLHLIEAKAADGEASRRQAADRAIEALTAAESVNPLLEETCNPLIAEARRLRTEMSG